MSIRVRLILLILLVGVLPIVIAVFWAMGYMENLAVESGKTVLAEIGRATIYDQALTTAQQVSAYLSTHSEIRVTDRATLLADEELAALAVQPVGKTGYTAVFGVDAVTLFHPNPNLVGVDMKVLAEDLPAFWEIFSAGLDGSISEGVYEWVEPDGSIREKYMVVVPVEGASLRVAATTYLDEFSEPTQQIETELRNVAALTRQRFVGSIVVIGLLSLVVALFVGMWLTTPIQEMADAAVRVAQGEWDAIQPTSRQDELGVLNQALYEMTSQLQDLVMSLETQVMERTESLERRARYLEATTAVIRDAVSILNLTDLLADVVNLVAQNFDFYHVGLFLLDPSGEWVELRAASSTGGQRMLARGYRVRVDEPSLLSEVVTSAHYQIVLEDSEHGVFLDNPDLPETRSQVALPLKVRDEVIGVLDVHSYVEITFIEEDLNTLQSLADLIAVAINNAYLFRQVEEVAEAERRARGEAGLEAWQRLLSIQPDMAFRSTHQGTFAAPELWYPEMLKAIRSSQMVADEEDGTRLAIPIEVAGNVIGVVEGRKPSIAGAWTSEDVALLRTLTEQLNAAVERARLYLETQRGAARERTIARVSSRMREPLELEDLLQTAVDEIRRALDMDELLVRLTVSDSDAHGSE